MPLRLEPTGGARILGTVGRRRLVVRRPAGSRIRGTVGQPPASSPPPQLDPIDDVTSEEGDTYA